MAASATVSAAFSFLSLRSRHHNILRHFLPFATSKPPLSAVSKPLNLTPLKANSSGTVEREETSTFIPPEGLIAPNSFDDGPIESEEEIARSYEDIYGPAYSGESYLGQNAYVMDSRLKKKTSVLGSKNKVKKVTDGFEEIVVETREVSRASKGGGRRSFRAVVVVGDRKGNVGVGMGKAKIKEVAIKKSAVDARRNIVAVPMTKYKTFPHRSEADYGAATVMLRPAAPGTGVIAGGAVRAVLELAGVKNALGKQLGSNNVLNNARATLAAVLKMRQFTQVAEDRGIPMEEMWT